ncbi:MAG TPA: hypothetical protein PLB38_01205 [bacterium]|nr:hypothetical protein [bacterium]
MRFDIAPQLNDDLDVPEIRVSPEALPKIPNFKAHPEPTPLPESMEYRSLKLQESKALADYIKTASGETIDRREQLLQGMVDRGNRHLESALLAGQIRQIGELPGPKLNTDFRELIGQRDTEGRLTNLNMICSFLESRGMSKVITDLQEGDMVVSFLASNKDNVSIKKLNDKIGPSLTDDFIVERKKELRKVFGADLLELDQDFKQGIFKLKPGVDLEGFKRTLPDKLGGINKALTAWLEGKGVILPSGELYELSSGMFENKIIDSSLGAAERNFLAVQNSIQGAHLNREKTQEARANGQIYETTELNNKLDQIKNLQEQLKSVNSITDAKGNVYNIFVDGQLNRDLIRKLRKDDFSVSDDENEKTRNLLSQYMKAINFIDFYRPYTLDELADDNSKVQEIRAKKALADKIRQVQEGGANLEFTVEEMQLLDKSISIDVKDKDFNSAEIFHQKAASFDTCTYLSFDVLDIGVDQLQDYENLIRKWNSGDKGNIQKEILAAGDRVTNNLRQFRATVKAIMDEAGFNEASYLVGGDEFAIALPVDKLPDDLLIKIKQACNKYNGVRVVQSLRQSAETAGLEEKHRQHQETLQSAERGIDGAKMVEKEIQMFRQSYIQKLRQIYGAEYNEKEPEIIANLDRLLSESGINNYFVKQAPGQEFDTVIWEKLPFSMVENDYVPALKKWKNYLDARFTLMNKL